MESVRSRIRPLLPSAALTLLIALAVALRIPSLYEPRWYRDEGIFAAIAHSIRSGDTLYADAWDNKPPLIFFTYAAIQAASAGEAGRGFAVVADEVQRLAERSANATKRIETLVQTIQSDTNEAVSSMEQTTAEVVAGARLAEDAGLALGEIEKVSNDLADLIQNISQAARQQSAAATNISATMNVIQEITTQTSVGASQTAESIGNLAQLAADLRRGFGLGIERFQLAGGAVQIEKDAPLRLAERGGPRSLRRRNGRAADDRRSA